MMKTLRIVMALWAGIELSALGGNAKEEAGAEPLRVGTFNVRYLNDTDGPNVWEHRKDHLRELIDFYEWDLFGVQEAVTTQLADIGKLARYDYVGVGRDDGAQKGEFAAIFYDRERFAVLESGTFWISPTPDEPSRGWDARASRICTWARLCDRSSGRVFLFFNTHLEHHGAEARREGAKVIASRIATLQGGEDVAVIVVGDFNCEEGEPPYVTMTTEAGLRDARFVAETPPYGPRGTFNYFDPTVPLERRIDYIFVSPDITVRRQAHIADMRDGRYPSDHLPVMVKVLLP